jgi:site-specific DNA-methyltransferase (adenine-specific)
MKPFYQDEQATIYHGDCRDILPGLPKVDLVLTDPPYGIGFNYGGYDDSPESWFVLMDRVVPQMRNVGAFVVMPCCKIARLAWWYVHHTPDWIICWYKGSPGHCAQIGFNDWEPLLTWGKPPIQMHDYFQSKCGFDDNGHPCPKPIQWAEWLVKRGCADEGTVIDPFMGSGTTLLAAKNLGRKAIGIEIEERYCEIAVHRLRQGVMDLGC